MGGMIEIVMSGPGQKTGAKFLTVSVASERVSWLRV